MTEFLPSLGFSVLGSQVQRDVILAFRSFGHVHTCKAGRVACTTGLA